MPDYGRITRLSCPVVYSPKLRITSREMVPKTAIMCEIKHTINRIKVLFVRHAQTLVAITSATGLTQIACRHTPADRTRFSSALEKMTLINVNI